MEQRRDSAKNTRSTVQRAYLEGTASMHCSQRTSAEEDCASTSVTAHKLYRLDSVISCHLTETVRYLHPRIWDPAAQRTASPNHTHLTHVLVLLLTYQLIFLGRGQRASYRSLGPAFLSLLVVFSILHSSFSLHSSRLHTLLFSPIFSSARHRHRHQLQCSRRGTIPGRAQMSAECGSKVS